MSKIKVISREQSKAILKMKDVMEAVEKVYILKAQGRSCLFPMVFHEFERGVADMDIKSGHMEDIDVFGLKLVSWFGENPKKNLPALMGVTMLFDSTTGQPLGLLNGEHITAMRTGAAAGIGAKYLAREDADTILMIGTGHISIYAVAASLMGLENLKRVLVYDPMNSKDFKEIAEKFKARIREEFPELQNRIDENMEIKGVENLEDAVRESGVILTATPSREPLVMRGWVTPGTHFSCIGADMEGKQEIHEDILKDGRVIVDDIDQSVSVGECEVPVKKNAIKREDIISEMGDIILSNIEGRRNSQDITVFDTTGIAHQDLITSKLVLDMAEKMGIGAEVEL